LYEIVRFPAQRRLCHADAMLQCTSPLLPLMAGAALRSAGQWLWEAKLPYIECQAVLPDR